QYCQPGNKCSHIRKCVFGIWSGRPGYGRLDFDRHAGAFHLRAAGCRSIVAGIPQVPREQEIRLLNGSLRRDWPKVDWREAEWFADGEHALARVHAPFAFVRLVRVRSAERSLLTRASSARSFTSSVWVGI